MKNFKEFIAKHTAVIAPLALAIAIMTANSTCYIFSYQPTPPKSLSKYRVN